MDERFPAKTVTFRSIDYQRGKVPTSPPAPSKWLYDRKRTIVNHIQKLIEQGLFLAERDLPEKTKMIINGGELPIPIVIKMADRKLAKSHRPNHLLSEIGSGVLAVHSLGKIIIGVTPDALEEMINIMKEIIDNVPDEREDWINKKFDNNGELRDVIMPERTREYELIHELTSIKELTSYNIDDVLEGMNTEQIEYAKADGKIKVRFFKYGYANYDNALLSSFLTEFKSLGVRRSKLEKLRFSSQLNTYLVPYINQDIMNKMANFPGVESVSSLLRFDVNHRTDCENQEAIQLTIPQEGKFYPKVAIVDSGISTNNKYLQPWVIKRETFVPLNRQDNYHGEFVGGMMVYGHLTNPEISNIVDSGIQIFDVIVLPDPKIEKIREDELIDALVEVLQDNSHEYKVWNLSLGSNRLCSGMISDFTAAIDELQDAYNVLFVFAAGNYKEMRESPFTEDTFDDDSDRINIPADSVRAITVGSVALNYDETTTVCRGQVVPYSRRGPGVGLTIKPDVVHYSGNPLKYPINSINNKGNIVSDFGTSFSAPIVSGILAEYYELYPGELSRTLAKALLIHGAKHPITNKRVTKANEHYFYGFGMPKRIQEILYGSEHEITLIFEGILNYKEGINWIKIGNFPFPESLVGTGKIRGEILLTLAYEPHLISNLGSEYCRCNLDLRLRSLVDNKYKTITTGSGAGDVWEEKWEKNQMTKELKWSPVKQMHFMSPVGTKGTNDIALEVFPIWRDTTDRRPVSFSIVVTISDPKRQVPVYNEISKLLLESFQFSDINLRYTPTRITGR